MDDKQLIEQLGALRSNIARLEEKVDFLFTRLQIQYVEPGFGEPGYMAEVRDWLAKGRLIEAIKVYRQNTGAGLAEAKKFVENLH